VDEERRGLLGKIAAALCVAGGTLLVGRFFWPRRLRDLSRRLKLGPASRLSRGSSRHLPGPDVHVMRTAAGVYAVSGRCTHLGCSVLKQPEGFACPCHGARFDLEGRPVSGPAPRPLTWFRVSVDTRGALVLHLDQKVEPGTLTRV
jgi:cytochrome b6-f complex iron-sulfur subunit